MKQPRYRLLALDLDGTVLNNQKHITPTTRRALEDAIAAGVTVIPASGRPFTGLCPEFLDIPGVEYALTSNGASLIRVADGRRIYADNLDDAIAADLMARFLPLTLVASFFLAGQGYAAASQLPLMDRLTVSPSVLEYLKSTRITLEDPVSFIRETGGVQKFTLNFPHLADGSWSDKEAVLSILADYPDLSIVSGGTDNLEITSPTATKGNALMKLAELLGIPREEVMACGDSENDLAMLKAAGFSVGMGNSEACVLQAVDAVTSTNEADGVAKAIYKYILA